MTLLSRLLNGEGKLELSAPIPMSARGLPDWRPEGYPNLVWVDQLWCEAPGFSVPICLWFISCQVGRSTDAWSTVVIGRRLTRAVPIDPGTCLSQHTHAGKAHLSLLRSICEEGQTRCTDVLFPYGHAAEALDCGDTSAAKILPGLLIMGTRTPQRLPSFKFLMWLPPRSLYSN
jgi:hypothetical protein